MNTTAHANILDSASILELVKSARLVCGIIILPIIAIPGILVNILNMVVLTRSWMRSSTNVYLTAVSVSDLFYLFSTLLFSLYLHEPMRRWGLYMNCVPTIRATANLLSNTSTWLTVTFTIERFIVVSSPIWGHRYCTRSKARYAVVIVYTSCFIFTFPDYLLDVVLNPLANASAGSPEAYYMIRDSRYKAYIENFGYVFINQTIFIFFPLILLSIFNILLIQKVIRANNQRSLLVKTNKENAISTTTSEKQLRSSNVNMNTQINTMDGRQNRAENYNKISTNTKLPLISEQQKITLMLICIVLSFIILQIPSVVPLVYEYIVHSDYIEISPRLNHILRIYSNISNILLVLNAALNFVFYSLFSLKFRNTCKTLLREQTCFCKKNDSAINSKTSKQNFRLQSTPLNKNIDEGTTNKDATKFTYCNEDFTSANIDEPS